MSRYLKFSLVISFLLFLFLGCSDKPFSKDDLPSYSKAFNINANPNKDLSEALAQAKKDWRKVLIEAGGDWCKWCGTFDNFMDENQDITKKLHENFVFVKIYYGKGINKQGQALLSQFPKITETPFFFVLDSNATLLEIVKSTNIERGYGYNKDKVLSFLNKHTIK